jgi:diguanylate cyclase (GGDEF)-like protein
MAIHTITDTNQTPPKPANTGAVPAPISEFEIPELQRTLKLAGLLQTSLDVENILQYFVDSIAEIIPFGGVEYSYASLDISFKSGKPDRHSCAYRLKIAGDDLGEIKFTRNKRFTEQEMEALENTIYHLVYPLRNSLQYQKAVRAAQMDALTGIYNRAAMDRSLEREVELSHRLDNQLSLLIVDVDHFKSINDTYGHSAGDAVLKSLVDCINDTMRVSDIMFRYGGEEFALILAGTGMDGARQVGERIRAAVAAYPFVYNGKEFDLTVSIGVATLGRRDSAKRLFNKADNALYQAKKAGRNQVHGSTEA